MNRLALAFVLLPSLAGADILPATGAQLRVLDKMTGVVADYDLAVGQSKSQGRLTVQLDECRYPSDLPTGEAYAHLTILDSDRAEPAFKGWMVASSPALSALDHPRYDVWVLRCDVSN
ncbi:MAG: DUF2155 domain-containing protein [Pseudorhodobacter sp.]|nr:DUF2155 domain-containing protein [Pseudorhodobacter sp.]